MDAGFIAGGGQVKRRTFNKAIQLEFRPNPIELSLPAPMDRRWDDEPCELTSEPWWDVEIRNGDRFMPLVAYHTQWLDPLWQTAYPLTRNECYPFDWPWYVRPEPVSFNCRCVMVFDEGAVQ